MYQSVINHLRNEPPQAAINRSIKPTTTHGDHEYTRNTADMTEM